ncbi:MAG: hypothetical protein M3Y08_11510, partial [Fibrobacterota bacterium]|nr:hypothetical protein [Fibrobacterota bacterium]
MDAWFAGAAAWLPSFGEFRVGLADSSDFADADAVLLIISLSPETRLMRRSRLLHRIGGGITLIITSSFAYQW